MHLLGGGQTLSWVDLRQADSKEAVAAAVKAAVGQLIHKQANMTVVTALQGECSCVQQKAMVQAFCTVMILL